MPRIRTIKPDFWRSEEIAALPKPVRLTFIGLWTYVDDNGVGLDNYKLVAAELYPLEDDPRESLANVREDLELLAKVDKIVRYTVAGKAYLEIVNWEKHQKIDRPGRPRYPTSCHPDAIALGCENIRNVPAGESLLDEPSRESRDTPSPGIGNREQGIGNREQGTSTSGKNPRRDEATRPDVDLICQRLADQIEANGSKRPEISAKWRTEARLLIDKDGRTVDQIIRAIDWCQNDPFWRPNVMSMPKLREKYDQLRLAAQRDTTARPNTHQPWRNPADQSVYDERL